MSAKIINNNGKILISDNAVATIAGISAMETYGIVGMAAKNATDGIFELLSFKNLTKGIRVNSNEKGVNIDIHVIIQFGINISVVSENLIEKVRFNVENQTGLKVLDINLFVQGIRVNE
ncbi:MAG: Asp23/Gls24 family envelope stress response protein [Ezakiella sp.]|nr:Asp23/Gls24 family envelope stress response protein [Ezakiella sp.]MDD7762003.1 Asp23/Gls24 family envelope stress response protein [Bacillota bacterium]MDY3946543.1 Asp23/Gls24 family envelope stress response protein [Ezakiella sp.]